MSFDVVTGSLAQPDSGFDVVTGDPDEDFGGLIEFAIPSVPIGTHLLVFIVRDGDMTPVQTGWTRILEANGGSGRYLDIWVHEIDRSDANLEDDDERSAIWVSVAEQEPKGFLLAYDNTSANVVLEAYANAAFAATATPTAPATTSQQAINKLIHIFSASAEIDFSGPAGYTTIDEYESPEGEMFYIVEKAANATGNIAAVAAAASPNATGRAWTIVLRNGPPTTPPELYDPVPGHLGLI